VLLITKKLASLTKWNEILKVHNLDLKMGKLKNSSHEWRTFESQDCCI